MKQRIETRTKYLSIAAACLALAAQAVAQVIYINDFESPVGPEWSTDMRDITPVGNRTFLGQFGNDTASLTLSGLAPHDSLTLSFDLFIIRTWDGNSGPDIWSLGVSGELTLLYTTFGNNTVGSQRQAYPDMFPGGDHPPHTGASEVNTLGYMADYGGGEVPVDSVYHLTFTLPHTESSVSFNFSASGLQELSDESWGLDNVSVAVPEPPTLVSAASRLRHSSAGAFDIDMPLTGESGVENRCSGTYTSVFVFDGPVTSGEVAVLSGTATVGTVTGSGNELLAKLKDVTDPEIVTLRVSNINGDNQQYGDIAFGFLLGDVNDNRIVDRPDGHQIRLDRNQTVNASNFRGDIDLSGVVDIRDLHGVTAHLGNSLP